MLARLLSSQMLVILILSATAYSSTPRELFYSNSPAGLSMLEASSLPFRMALPPRKHKSFQRVLRQIQKVRGESLALSLENGQNDRRSPLKDTPATPKAQINVTVFVSETV
jgi:hypothetical protein